MTHTANIYAPKTETIRVRFRSGAQWYTGAAWSSDESTAQLTTLTEVEQEASALENFFYGVVTVPDTTSGDCELEYLDSNSTVIAVETLYSRVAATTTSGGDAYLKMASFLTDCQTMIGDSSATARARLLAYANGAILSIVTEPRDWEFLKKSDTQTIASNSVALPVDFSLFTSCTVDDGTNTRYFDTRNIMTDADIYAASLLSLEYPLGIELTAGTMTFHPAASGTSVLKYVAGYPGSYADTDAVTTVIPYEFSNFLQRAVLSAWYEADNDEKVTLSVQFDPQEMKKLKALDNKRKPQLQMNRHGYTRGRI